MNCTHYETPYWFFQHCYSLYGKGKPIIDLAAQEDNAKSSNFYTDYTRAPLDEKYFYWLNPPFGKGIDEFIEFFMDSINGRGFDGCLLVPDHTSSQWFHRLLSGINADLTFYKGRLQFNLDGVPMNNNAHGTVVLASCSERKMTPLKIKSDKITKIKAESY